MTPADTQDAATTLTGSDRADLLVEDPMAQFDAWLGEARASEINDANAMTLATVDGSGVPDARIVLLKGVDGRGFVFYTNTQSAKGEEIGASAQAALIFHWKSLRRQVRVRGPVERVTDEEADAYYATRPRGSRIGAWASQQSRPLESRATLEAAVAEVERRFPDEAVPRPPHWSGYRIVPLVMEFWRDGASRLHDRAQFTRAATQDGWSRTRLYP